MLTELCKELHNWFEVDKIFGKFDIVDGSIDLTDYHVQDGQYFRIIGSIFNDGVYQYPVNNLGDETFDGAIWLMAVPPAVVQLASEIGAWVGKYNDVINSPYSSESFGGYSYTKANGYADGSGGSTSWQSVFSKRLNQWRKI